LLFKIRCDKKILTLDHQLNTKEFFMNPSKDAICNCIRDFSPVDLNDGTLPAEGFKANQQVTYNGRNFRVFHGISDSFKVDIVAGHKLEVCKNQYINHRDADYSGKSSGEPKVRAHFKLIGKGEHHDCMCGACGFVWHFEQDTCNCEQKPPLDPKEEACSIQ
jgi:hypothetical protein